MDTRTASALCFVDLAPLIEAGNFRRLDEAERIVDELAASATVQDRAVTLYQLGDDLSRVKAPQPEADAFLRAVRAIVRHRLEACFHRRSARGMLSEKQGAHD